MELERAWRLCAQEDLFPPRGGVVLAAVSGGADSMCLLAWLCLAGRREGFRVEAAHFDHQIRPESGGDRRFVEDWCREHNVPFHWSGADIPALAQGENLEDTARRWRYRFLEDTARRRGAQRIATAHNAQDNGETMLLHLTRGAGLQGLCGIAPREGRLIRPLLTTSREEILAFNAAHGIPHVEDATNRDLRYSRNYLRHQVYPLLQELNPALTQALNRCAASLREDQAYLAQAAQALVQAARREGERVWISAAALAQAPRPVAFRAIPLLAGMALNRFQREGVLALCEKDCPSGQVYLPGGRRARRVYERLVLEPTRQEEGFAPVRLDRAGITQAGGWRVTCERDRCPGGKHSRPLEFYLREGDYLLRPRAAGDQITLPGRPRKTVKKLFIEGAVPREDREQIPVFTCGGQVAALAGFGADAAFLPREGELCLHIQCQRDEV